MILRSRAHHDQNSRAIFLDMQKEWLKKNENISNGGLLGMYDLPG